MEVIFARGTTEPAGVGWLGTAFINSVRSKVGAKSVSTYAVNYPADWNLYTSVRAGGTDALARVHATATTCPDTRIVLGGYSQGAGVVDVLAIGQRVGLFTPMPIPAEDEPHVAALAVFGNPMRTMNGGGPLPDKSPVYGSRTIDQCATGDQYCDAGPSTNTGHYAYVQNGMVDEAAAFVAGRV
ncbi:cutinase family protein [Mycobacterium sp. PSTR-4-N]|uniref:cutinase family protein n=1 Tax=Mycobacterium sp. PSTR-4-N TaxID=2917745 RepID=UPI001F1537B4|nr:cutinase family protein [Mycobacterium sp. PSTR-4-N]MCG7594668.1 cutinase family protein [Mycobacterium sp. PSTR-4-N]